MITTPPPLGDTQMANKHTKKSTKHPIIREKKEKATPSYYLTSVRMAIIKKSSQITNAGEGVEKREPSSSVGGTVNWYNNYGEQYGGTLENYT